MDVTQWLRFLLTSTIFAGVLFAHSVHADTWNIALVRCDEGAGTLEAFEDSTEDDVEVYKTPSGYQSKWLGTLVQYIAPPDGTDDDATNGTYRQKISEWNLSCKLKSAVYDVVVSPWSENDMVMGQCGGGDSDMELTVRRNNRVLFKDLRFGGGCRRGPDGSVVIVSITLSESNELAEVNALHVTKDFRDVNFSVRRSFFDMPQFSQANLRATEADELRECVKRNVGFDGKAPLQQARVVGQIGSRIYLHPQFPPSCESANVGPCKVTAYVVPGDIVADAKTCGEWAYVQYVGKSRPTTGWVEIGTIEKAAH